MGAPKSADVQIERAGNQMKGVRDHVVLGRLRPGRDGNVTHGRKRRRDGFVDLGLEALGLQQAETFIRRQRAAGEVLVHQARRCAVEGDEDELWRGAHGRGQCQRAGEENLRWKR